VKKWGKGKELTLPTGGVVRFLAIPLTAAAGARISD
jgi:hypothetical protein